MAIDRRFIELYDEYTHKPLARRVFLERLMALAGSATVAQAVLGSLEPNHALAAMVPEADPRIVVGRVAVDTPLGRVAGYSARPRSEARHPAIMVIHENRGLNPHIEDITRRLAIEGFVALGVDFLTPLGGTPTDADAARGLFTRLTVADVMPQARAALALLKSDPQGNGKVGAVGFCWGGTMINEAATRLTELDAAVVYYGGSPDPALVPNIRSPLLMHHAGLDKRLLAGLPAYEAALKAAGKPYTLHVYEGVDHAFNNDAGNERYNEAAAKLAWARTIDFFKAQLA